MRFYRGDREIKPKKITDVDWQKAGYKSFAEFQGEISALTALTAEEDMALDPAEQRRAEQCREAEDRAKYHDLRLSQQ